MYRIGEFLTPSERLEAMRLGGLKKLASMGMKPSDFGLALEKSAQSPGSSAMDLLGATLRTAVMIGAPLGAVWYAVNRPIRRDSMKTKKLKARLDHYNDASADAMARLYAAYPQLREDEEKENDEGRGF